MYSLSDKYFVALKTTKALATLFAPTFFWTSLYGTYLCGGWKL